MHEAPTSVKILSILGLVFVVNGVLGIVVGVGMLMVGGMLGPNPVLATLSNDTGYLVGSGIMLALSVLLHGWLLACSIGGLNLKPWARKGMLTYAWLQILQIAANGIFTAAYVVPLMLSAIAGNLPPGVRAIVLGAVIGGTAFGLVFALIYPCCVLYFYTRRYVIDAFQGIFPPSRDAEEECEEDREDRDADAHESTRITNRPPE